MIALDLHLQGIYTSCEGRLLSLEEGTLRSIPRFHGCCLSRYGLLKADSHIVCRAHAVRPSCRAAKGLECVFPIWFTQCGHVWFTRAMPRPCHPRPCYYSQGHGTAWPSREVLWANCPRSASSRYHAEFHEVVIKRIPITDSGGQCETKHRLSWTREKSGSSTLQDDLLLSSDISGYHVWINARHGRGTACYVWIGLWLKIDHSTAQEPKIRP